ncbi:hypothetical protein NONO_c38960 [Nocardia nova SH22a]|uniref:Uncharacterized protein n=1 Tax=Nocardia nova SH22a TaxID=1415166 RepID=W5TH32_9NOCA|nr:hypothetical protein [Nocardia nova]AHH18680.1 hypothetical protein NONO_c38960 [Nocardia nova SH22a]
MLVARGRWRRLELTYDDRPAGRLVQRRKRAIAYLPTATLTFNDHSNFYIRAYPVPDGADPLAPPSVPATMTGTTTEIAEYAWTIRAWDRCYRMVQGKGDRYTVTEDGDLLGEGRFTAFFVHRQWLSVPATVPLEHQAFIVWLAYRTFLPRQTDL